MTNTAYISGENRRGVVYTRDGKVFVIEMDKLLQPELAGATHLGMWMQGTRPIVKVDAGTHPFASAYAALSEAVANAWTEACAIRIVVVPSEGFVCFYQNQTNPPSLVRVEVAQALYGPRDCVGESMEVWRGGALLDTCYIQSIGTHGAYLGFEGLQQVCGPSRYHQKLEPKQFNPGDELRIRDLRGDVTPAEYWRQMTLAKARAPSE